jgi:hypothetical protein
MDALEKSETLLNETGEMARIGGWEIDLETNRVIWTRTTRAIHEVPEEFEPDLASAIDFFPRRYGVIWKRPFSASGRKEFPMTWNCLLSRPKAAVCGHALREKRIFWKDGASACSVLSRISQA